MLGGRVVTGAGASLMAACPPKKLTTACCRAPGSVADTAMLPMTRPAPDTSADPEVPVREALERGDVRGALAQLVSAYRDPLFGFCRDMLRDASLAEDVLQTTFVQAYRDLPKFEPRSTLRAWLYAIARNRCLDAIKAERRRRARFEVLDGDPGADQAPRADRRLEEREIEAALDRCLETLAPHVRMAVLLHHQQGISYREMATICRERPATLQARVARAMPVLRRCIEARSGGVL
jgi:RNA polymerase sigma factor (sigma-70 family)